MKVILKLDLKKFPPGWLLIFTDFAAMMVLCAYQAKNSSIDGHCICDNFVVRLAICNNFKGSHDTYGKRPCRYMIKCKLEHHQSKNGEGIFVTCLGRRIARLFDGVKYFGTVDRYDGVEDGLALWHTTHDDGDEEQLDFAELMTALQLHNAPAELS